MACDNVLPHDAPPQVDTHRQENGLCRKCNRISILAKYNKFVEPTWAEAGRGENGLVEELGLTLVAEGEEGA